MNGSHPLYTIIMFSAVISHCDHMVCGAGVQAKLESEVGYAVIMTMHFGRGPLSSHVTETVWED